jgi:hypothetical protein
MPNEDSASFRRFCLVTLARTFQMEPGFVTCLVDPF